MPLLDKAQERIITFTYKQLASSGLNIEDYVRKRTGKELKEVYQDQSLRVYHALLR